MQQLILLALPLPEGRRIFNIEKCPPNSCDKYFGFVSFQHWRPWMVTRTSRVDPFSRDMDSIKKPCVINPLRAANQCLERSIIKPVTFTFKKMKLNQCILEARKHPSTGGLRTINWSVWWTGGVGPQNAFDTFFYFYCSWFNY